MQHLKIIFIGFVTLISGLLCLGILFFLGGLFLSFFVGYAKYVFAVLTFILTMFMLYDMGLMAVDLWEQCNRSEK